MKVYAAIYKYMHKNFSYGVKKFYYWRKKEVGIEIGIWRKKEVGIANGIWGLKSSGIVS